MIEYLTEQEVLNMDTNYIIETKNLTKQYGSQKSVADLNIQMCIRDSCYVMPNAFSTGGSWFDGLAAVQLPQNPRLVIGEGAFYGDKNLQIVHFNDAVGCLLYTSRCV